jgi:hypothetical protein
VVAKEKAERLSYVSEFLEGLKKLRIAEENG